MTNKTYEQLKEENKILKKNLANLRKENILLKKEIADLQSRMSYMKAPNTFGDNHEMGCW